MKNDGVTTNKARETLNRRVLPARLRRRGYLRPFLPRDHFDPSDYSSSDPEVCGLDAKQSAPQPKDYLLWPLPCRIWNQVRDNLSYTFEVYPESDSLLVLGGWCFDLGSRRIRGVRFVVNEKVVRSLDGQPRRDAALLFPDQRKAARSGFTAVVKPQTAPAEIELQVSRGWRSWETVAALKVHPEVSRQCAQTEDVVAHSGLVDPAWYHTRYRVTSPELHAAVSHYLRLGAVLGYDPNPLFFSEWYWKQAPTVLEQGANPLWHYLFQGAGEGVRPNPFFDSRWYLHRYDEARDCGLNPLSHYLHYGGRSGQFNPSLEFNARFYLQRHPEVRRQKSHPLVHYLYHGQAQGDPSTPDLNDCWHYRGPRFHLPARANRELVRARVAIVGHLLPSTLFGSENSLIDLIAAIDHERFDLLVVFPEKNDQAFARLRPHVQGICVLDYFWWHKELPFQERTVALFERLYRELAIDLVHVNTIMLSDPHLAARRAGIPSIANVRELISGDETLAARLGTTADDIGKTVCRHATYLLANSAATLADYPCADKGGYVYNSIDARVFDLPNIVDTSRIKVGLVSSNIAKKGVMDFLALAREAEGILPTLEFHLIGPENNLPHEWFMAAKTLPANFRVRGYVAHPPDAYCDLNIVVNLSRFAESFGRTVAEAMAARRPVIAYRHGALPELIEDGETGFLVPYLDLSAVLERLRFFVEQPANITRFGEAARSRIIERCSRDVLTRKLTLLYERLLGPGVSCQTPRI